MFKPKLPKQEQGFTLVEVLVAILIATIFIAVAMQMMTIAAVFKVRAQEYAEATTWIQEDLEYLKYQASSYQYTSLTANSVSTTTPPSSSITVASVNDLAVNDTLQVGSASGTYTISSITNNTLTITPKLTTEQSQGAFVTATTRCNPSSATDPSFNNGVQGKLPASPISQTSKLFPTKTYSLTRTITSDSPYRVLKVSYNVTPSSGGASVASSYTEVIPNAALQCPN